MNPLNSPAPGHDITRRNFMKKSALTVGAVTVLSRGIALAEGVSISAGVTGTPAGGTRFTNITFYDPAGDGKFGAKIEYASVPVSGTDPGSVLVRARIHAWKEVFIGQSPVKISEWVALTGTLSPAGDVDGLFSADLVGSPAEVTIILFWEIDRYVEYAAWIEMEETISTETAQAYSGTIKFRYREYIPLLPGNEHTHDIPYDGLWREVTMIKDEEKAGNPVVTHSMKVEKS